MLETNEINVGDYIKFQYWSPAKIGEVGEKEIKCSDGLIKPIKKRVGVFKVVFAYLAGVAYNEEEIFRYYEPQDEKSEEHIRKFFVNKKVNKPRIVIDKGTSYEVIPLTYTWSKYYSILGVFHNETTARSAARDIGFTIPSRS